MSPVIRTVRGDLPPGELGRTDYHEHLLMRSPLLAGDELTDLDRSATETAELREAGIDALVELTPIGCGRDPQGVAAISARTGMHVVLATGVHREAHYHPEHPLRAVPMAELADQFVRDLTSGCRDTSPTTQVRAGVIKVGVGYWSISEFERRNLLAAAEAHGRTGAPIICHLEQGTAAWEVLGLLGEAGVATERVALAHADRNPDPGLHLALTAAGAYLGYDGAGRTKYWPDSTLIDCLMSVAAQGGAGRLLLGGDVARSSSFRAYGGLPGMAYLPRVFLPRLARAAGQQLVDTILIDNPARFLTFSPPAE